MTASRKCYPRRNLHAEATGAFVHVETILLVLNANEVADALPYDQLINALAAAFGDSYEVPPRAHHEVALPDGRTKLLPV